MRHQGVIESLNRSERRYPTGVWFPGGSLEQFRRMRTLNGLYNVVALGDIFTGFAVGV